MDRTNLKVIIVEHKKVLDIAKKYKENAFDLIEGSITIKGIKYDYFSCDMDNNEDDVLPYYMKNEKLWEELKDECDGIITLY